MNFFVFDDKIYLSNIDSKIGHNNDRRNAAGYRRLQACVFLNCRYLNEYNFSQNDDFF